VTKLENRRNGRGLLMNKCSQT